MEQWFAMIFLVPYYHSEEVIINQLMEVLCVVNPEEEQMKIEI